MFLEFGCDPRAMDTMSLYEIISMQQAYVKRQEENGEGKARPMTDEEFEASKDVWRNMNLPDVVI
jgi:hypothetical protein